jgi:hypothetical protein
VSHGSSVLPDIQPARQAVMREVLQLLQEEMGQSTILPRSAERARRLEPDTTLIATVNRSFESLNVSYICTANFVI